MTGDMSRKQAEESSRDCAQCDGGGYVPVYHPRYTGSTTVTIASGPGRTATIAGRVNAHCVCALGRWMRERIRITAPELLGRIPDLIEVFKGRSEWLAEDPCEGTESVAVTAPTGAPTPSEFARSTAREGQDNGPWSPEKPLPGWTPDDGDYRHMAGQGKTDQPTGGTE